jgi:hypothetical protein
MKKIAMLSLSIMLTLAFMLNASSFMHWQPSGTVLTFTPEQPTSVPQNVSSCARGTITKKGSLKPMSILSDTAVSCDSLFFDIENFEGAQEWQQSYDTTKAFIEHCYNDPRAPSTFNDFSASRQQLERSDSTLWLQSELWLESVLYLNTTNPEYFCKCVEAMQVGPATDTGGEEQYWIDQNKGLALLRWLIQNTTCDTPLLQNEFNGTRASQYEDWLNDTTVPLDTTIPSLASLGLGLDTLLAKHFLYVNSVRQPQPGIISNATANPNPANSGTVISFSIRQEAYVKIELFDVLGHEVSSYDYESLFEPGNKSVSFSLAGLTSGTYFARIMTAYGEVQSVKLVKE